MRGACPSLTVVTIKSHTWCSTGAGHANSPQPPCLEQKEREKSGLEVGNEIPKRFGVERQFLLFPALPQQSSRSTCSMAWEREDEGDKEEEREGKEGFGGFQDEWRMEQHWEKVAQA